LKTRPKKDELIGGRGGKGVNRKTTKGRGKKLILQQRLLFSGPA